ncbi:cation:proton antiporter [Candidatus Kaiserbacteria bacterium]|nr:cation:proton antiporter [Candidatus Kaiserbacteria bacterium]
MVDFYPFFLIVFSGVLFSMLSIRTHIPWAVMLVVGGIIFGPSFLGFIEINPTIDFIGQVGLIFLMFMAGLETRVSQFKDFKTSLLLLAFINGFVPFLVGFGAVLLLGYELITALIVGIIFISSSVAVVIPSLEISGLLNTKLGQSVIITTVLQDISSLVLLSLLLQSVSPVTEVPLYVFYPVLLGVLIALRLLIPKLRVWVVKIATGSPDLFQLEFRSTFLMLIGTVIAFELLGLHPIVAGFFSGLVLADSIKSKVLKEKIKTISYGVFIPTFFIVVGLRTDIGVFKDIGNVYSVLALIIFSLVSAKYLSGFIAARIVGFNKLESSFFAVTSLPQLSTTLATAFVAFNLGLIDEVLLTSLVILSIVTVLISPMLIRTHSDRLKNS